MNQYYKLLKQEVIVFEKLIIDKYHLIGLNEIETIVLIKLNNSLKEGKRRLVIEDVVPNMTLDKDTLSKCVVDLVNRGYITVELSQVDALETFNLDGTLKRLSEVFEENNSLKVILDSNISKTINMIETETCKQISAIDLEIINSWYKTYNYSFESVKAAFDKAAINKKVSVKYIDRILANSKTTTKTNTIDSFEMKDLISKVYGTK